MLKLPMECPTCKGPGGEVDNGKWRCHQCGLYWLVVRQGEVVQYIPTSTELIERPVPEISPDESWWKRQWERLLEFLGCYGASLSGIAAFLWLVAVLLGLVGSAEAAKVALSIYLAGAGAWTFLGLLTLRYTYRRWIIFWSMYWLGLPCLWPISFLIMGPLFEDFVCYFYKYCLPKGKPYYPYDRSRTPRWVPPKYKDTSVPPVDVEDVVIRQRSAAGVAPDDSLDEANRYLLELEEEVKREEEDAGRQ